MQNFQNHKRMDWGWVILFLLSVYLLLIHSIDIYLRFNSEGIEEYSAWIKTLNFNMIISGIVITWIIIKFRSYATKLQDRIIVQEMQFRHFVMTGKILSTQLSNKQIIALRFAGDNQFLHLCEQAAKLGLSQKAIKELITDWKADMMRV